MEAIDLIQLKEKVIFVHGDWGIGKTHFAKEKIFDKFKDSHLVMYIDSRVFDQSVDIYGLIVEFIESYDTNGEKLKESIKNLPSVGKNIARWAINNFFKTNFSYSDVSKTSTVTEKLESTKTKPILFIFDELDRLTPETAIKVINFINGLSIMREENMNIIAIGNKKALNDTLVHSFGFSENIEYLDKYFEATVDLNAIAMKNISDVVEKHSLLLPQLSKITNNMDFFMRNKIFKTFPSARLFERAIKKVKISKESDNLGFTSSLYLLAVFAQIGIKPDSFTFNDNSILFYDGKEKVSISIINSAAEDEYRVSLLWFYGINYAAEHVKGPLYDLIVKYDGNIELWFETLTGKKWGDSKNISTVSS